MSATALEQGRDEEEGEEEEREEKEKEKEEADQSPTCVFALPGMWKSELSSAGLRKCEGFVVFGC